MGRPQRGGTTLVNTPQTRLTNANHNSTFTHFISFTSLPRWSDPRTGSRNYVQQLSLVSKRPSVVKLVNTITLKLKKVNIFFGLDHSLPLD